MRLQNFANEEFGIDRVVGRLRPALLQADRHQRDQRNADREVRRKCPIRKTYTCNPQTFGYLDQPQNKLRVPMHYVLKNDKANHLGTAPLQSGKVRIFRRKTAAGIDGVPRRRLGQVHAASTTR